MLENFTLISKQQKSTTSKSSTPHTEKGISKAESEHEQLTVQQRIAGMLALAKSCLAEKQTAEGEQHYEAALELARHQFARNESPTYPSTDNDPLFEFHPWKASLRVLEIEEKRAVPYVPLSHPFVERLIGTIRREYLDHVPFWNARDLERKLSSFQHYYNRERTHQGIGGAIPDPELNDVDRKTASFGNYRWKSRCRGLYQLPVPA